MSGMIGGVEETSASFEARSAPRLYPTERLGVELPTRHKLPCRVARENVGSWMSNRSDLTIARIPSRSLSCTLIAFLAK